MSDILTAHTADLDGEKSAAIRALLEGALAVSPDGEFGDAGGEHTVGGMHVRALEGGEPVAHASVVQCGCYTAGGRCAPDTWRV